MARFYTMRLLGYLSYRKALLMVRLMLLFVCIHLSVPNVLLGQRPQPPAGSAEDNKHKDLIVTSSIEREKTSAVLTYGTYFGGSSDDHGLLVAADSIGNVFIAGSTQSDSLPGTQGAFQPTRAQGLPGHWATFVAKFDGTGRKLLWASFLSGDGSDSPTAIAVDKSGSVLIAGTTTSSNFPVSARAYQSAQSSNFLTKLSSDGRSLVYSTYLKGMNVAAMTVNDAGEAFLTGQYVGFQSMDFTPGSVSKPAYPEVLSVFLLRLKSDGSGLVYGANLGGGGGLDGAVGTSIALDSSGNCYVAGTQRGNSQAGITTSNGSYQPIYSNGGLTNSIGPGILDNGFIVKVNESGSRVLFGTYFGPRFYGTSIRGIVIDPAGGVYFAGISNAPSLASQTAPGAGSHAYLAHLRSDGGLVDQLSYMTAGITAIKGDLDNFLHVLSSGNYALVRSSDLSAVSSLAIPPSVSNFALASGRVTWFVGTTHLDNAPFITNDAFQFKPKEMNDAILLQAIDIQPSIAAILSSAGGPAGPVSPGQLVSIFGSEIGPVVGANLQLDISGKVGSGLGETRVLFDGTPAPLLYARADQVNAVIPFAVAGHATTQVIAEYKGVQSRSFSVPIVASAPVIFTVNGKGTGQVAALNQDGSVNSASNPAARGSIVVMFATGGGLINPAVDGSVIGGVLPTMQLPTIVGLSNAGVNVLYAGPAPGLVAGVVQINFQVPDDAPVGSAVPVVVQIGTAYSPTVTLAVQ